MKKRNGLTTRLGGFRASWQKACSIMSITMNSTSWSKASQTSVERFGEGEKGSSLLRFLPFISTTSIHPELALSSQSELYNIPLSHESIQVEVMSPRMVLQLLALNFDS